VPALGALVCAALIVSRVTTPDARGEFEWRAPLTAGAVLLGILVLYALMRPTRVIEEEVE
jgi:hypothetical protein